MKVSFPLSLKISLWLLLNLLLLAAVGVGFLVTQGGIGWDALLSGAAGERAQTKASGLVSEVASTAAEARKAALVRLGSSYGAELFVFHFDDGQLLGAGGELPADVKRRLEAARGPGRGPFGREFGPPPRGGRGGDGPGGRGPRGEGPPPDDFRRREKGSPPPAGMREPGDFGRDRESGRFVMRSPDSAGYWVGLRTFFASAERGRPTPAMLVVRFDSLWTLLRFLDHEAWIVGGAAALGLSILFWLPLIRGITRSVGTLTAATEQIADGRFDTRVPAARRDEIGRLGESVNRMAIRLDAHITGQKRFLGDVAHELCSPLARLQMASGILAERAPADLRETVVDVRDEVQQMSALVNELLAFTKAGLQPRAVELRNVALAPLVQNVLAREDAAARVTIAVPAELHVRADADLLSRAVANLVRNALRYAGEASPIALSAQGSSTHVTIAIDDEGPGVPTEALDRLGEPFFRPETARTRESGGVGLGLSIVRSSIAACGGEVRFANRSPRGFHAELRLAPAAKA